MGLFRDCPSTRTIRPPRTRIEPTFQNDKSLIDTQSDSLCACADKPRGWAEAARRTSRRRQPPLRQQVAHKPLLVEQHGRDGRQTLTQQEHGRRVWHKSEASVLSCLGVCRMCRCALLYGCSGASNDLTRGGYEAGVHAATLRLPCCLLFPTLHRTRMRTTKVGLVKRQGRGVVGRRERGRGQATGNRTPPKRKKTSERRSVCAATRKTICPSGLV